MFKTFLDNLSSNQRIAVLLISQFLVVIVLALVVQTFIVEKKHVEIDTAATEDSVLPANVKDEVAKSIWEVVRTNVPDVGDSSVDDVVIREGTYVEEENRDGSFRASFLVDIDSLKQTYTVSTGWTRNKREVREVIVDCPPISEMKYEDTVCYGMYRNTYSFDLYFPYSEYLDEFADEDEGVLAPDYMVSADEDNKIITVMVSACNVDGFKAAAMEYLETVPIDLSDFQVNVEVNDINVGC